MALMISAPQRTFVLHPAGTFPAVISKVVHHRDVQTQFGVKDRVQVTFETAERVRDHSTIDTDAALTVSLFCNATVGRGSRLKELLEAAFGVERVAADIKAGEIDVERLVGTQWIIGIEHSESNGATYANIKSYVRAPAGTAPVAATEPAEVAGEPVTGDAELPF